MPECEFKAVCDELYEDTEHDCVFYKYDEIKACDDRKTLMKLFKTPQFTKQYAKLSEVEKVLRGLPVWQDDFQLEKVLSLIRRTE